MESAGPKSPQQAPREPRGKIDLEPMADVIVAIAIMSLIIVLASL